MKRAASRVNASFVIPDCRQRVQPEVAGPMTSSAASPESIITIGGYGFRVPRFARPRNDEASLPRHFTAENAVGWRIWLCAFARIGPSFSLSARAEIQAGSLINAFHFFSRSASDSQANK